MINLNSKITINSNELREINYYIEMIQKDFNINIPIFFVNEKVIERYVGKDKKRDFNPATDLLGVYLKENGAMFDNDNVILISPDKIIKYTNNEKEFILLLTKVIIHEIAHFIMDNKTDKKDEFYRYMEESLANLFTLNILELDVRHMRYKKEINFIKDFVSKQPLEYALGYKLYSFLEIKKRFIDLMLKWRDNKSKISQTSKDKWLNYIKQSNIDEKILMQYYEDLWK